MNELFSTYKAVEPISIPEANIEIPDFKSKYDTFLENLQKYKRLQKHQSTNPEQGNVDQEWFSDTKVQQSNPNISIQETHDIDYTTKDLATMLKEQGLDKYIRISSGFRDHNVGKAGNKSNHRRKNAHGHSMAYDIVPINGETFDSIYDRISKNESMQKWLAQNGFNVNDETSAAMLKKTGGTGAHFHIGPDSFNIRKASEGIDTSDVYSVYEPINTTTHNYVEIPDLEINQADIDTYSRTIPEDNPEATNNNQTNTKDDQKWFKHTKLKVDNKISSESITPDNQTKNDPAIKSPGFDADFAKYGTSDIFTKHKSFWKKLALSESSFNPNAANKSGAYGYFQIMPQSRTGSDVQTQFKDAEKLMTSMMGMLTEDDRKLAKQKGISEEGLMAGVWLGGPGGVKRALAGKGNAKDSNGTSVIQYMKKFT